MIILYVHSRITENATLLNNFATRIAQYLVMWMVIYAAYKYIDDNVYFRIVRSVKDNSNVARFNVTCWKICSRILQFYLKRNKYKRHSQWLITGNNCWSDCNWQTIARFPTHDGWILHCHNTARNQHNPNLAKARQFFTFVISRIQFCKKFAQLCRTINGMNSGKGTHGYPRYFDSSISILDEFPIKQWLQSGELDFKICSRQLDLVRIQSQIS